MATASFTPATPVFPTPPKEPEKVTGWLSSFIVTLQATLLRLRREINRPDTIQTRRVHSHNAILLVTGDAVLSTSPSWGTTPSHTVAGTDQRGTVVATAGSGTPGASPTITLTFTEGEWPVAPFALVTRNDTNSPTGQPTWTTSTTALVITFNGTPTASTAYTFEFHVWG
jgi:hypothetical protein